MLLSRHSKCITDLKFLLRTVCIAFFLLTVLYSCKKGGEKIQLPQPDPPIKPNIVLFLADDYGYEIPGCDGGDSYQTTNINNMAKNGMLFTQCYSSPLCSPSRIMLLTGKYNFRNYTAWGRLGLDQKTFANMMNDAGYSTCMAGKWQIEGGDDTLKSFGFSNYCVWNINNKEDDDFKGSRYKNPKVYVNGHYLPDDSVANKYGDDIFTDYAKKFISDNATGDKPFFLYLPFCLTHAPFSPTPDDPDFASWNSANPGDRKYFPSMVNYMDKKIGEVIAEINTLHLDSKTIFLFTGDNGTARGIVSQFNGSDYRGGKGLTIQSGTHVPLIAYCPGFILPSVNNNLIDFTDFLPTLADIAGISKPTNYGILDGQSFYPQLFQLNYTPRDWVFCHFAPDKGDIPVRYVQNSQYKYYEDDRFYNLNTDIFEHDPISTSKLTPDEFKVRTQFKEVLSQLHN